jgi:hypothetical protein
MHLIDDDHKMMFTPYYNKIKIMRRMSHQTLTVFLLCVILSIFTILKGSQQILLEQSESSVLIAPSTQFAALISAQPHPRQTPSANVSASASQYPPQTANDTAVKQPFELCFITSVFAEDLASADTVGNVTEHRLSNPTFQYLVFTNREDILAPGWNHVVLADLPYQRLITQSRWAKFVPWQHEETAQTCPIIFYLDGYTIPINTPHAAQLFRDAAQRIRAHDFGLGQYQKRGSRIKGLAKGLVQEGKDTAANVNYTMSWLKAQPDFRRSCTVYLNRHIGLDPQNPNYRKLSSYFWDLYSQEKGSWRDQLLWCYVVDKFHADPVNLHGDVSPIRKMFEERRDQMGYNGHTYVVLDSTSIQDNQTSSR